MGRGIWFPKNNSGKFEWGEQIIIDSSDIYDTEECDYDINFILFENFWEMVQSCLPKSFQIQNWNKTPFFISNNLVGVELHEEDTLIHIVVGALNFDDGLCTHRNLAPIHVRNTLFTISNYLKSNNYKLYRRDTAYTLSEI